MLGAARATVRFTGVTITAGSESVVAGGGAVNGIQEGPSGYFPTGGEPSPHLRLLTASLIKCGLCAEWAQRHTVHI